MQMLFELLCSYWITHCIEYLII